MNNYRPISTIIAGIMLSATMSVAQQNPALPADAPSSDPQTQAAQPYGPLYKSPANADAQAQAIPDNRPLSGILGLTLGSLTATQNTFSAGFRFGQSFDSNPAISGTGSDYTGESMVSTSLNLHRANAQQSLDIRYNGGATIYNDTVDHTTFHQLNLAEIWNMGRWTVTLTDYLNYSTQGDFGQGFGLDRFLSGSVGQGGMNVLLTPNQSIYTPLSRSLSNTAGGQIQYGLSPRSSWTVGMTYGNLYFPDNDFANTHQIGVRTGYNRNWTARDTISIFYDYGAYRGRNGVGDDDIHSVSLAYARRVTGRLTWTVAGGPQFVIPVKAGDTALSWTATTGLQYQRGRTGLNWAYDRGVSEGILGATKRDELQVGVNRMITRHWIASANGGLARNIQIPNTTEFRSGFAGAQVQRSLGERASIFFNYAFQRQISDGSCASTICTGLTRQGFGFGFSWTPRTWILR